MKSEIFKAWSLVLQLGISMLVPIFLLVAMGFLIKKYFDLDVMIVCIIIGLATGIRNVYVLIKNYLDIINKQKNTESELLKKHHKQFAHPYNDPLSS